MAEFEKPTVETLYGRMKADLEERLDTSNWFSRTLSLILISVFAGAIYLCYGFLQKLAKQLFFNTATGEWLDWHARKYGLPRIAATYSTGQVRFTGVNTTAVPAGTELVVESGEIYETDSEVTISGGYADADITAQVAGTAGNVSVTTMELVSSITDIDDEVSVLETPSGGVAEEVDTALRTRLMQRTQNPPGSGNPGDYVRWALETAGIGRAWVKSAADWYGSGTVGVIVSTSSLEVVSSTIKSNMETYIESKRPVGADVTYADIIPNEVDFWISITPNTTSYQTEIETALSEIFMLDSGPGETVKLSSIRQSIGNTGVDDYDITAIQVDGTPVSVADIESTGLNTPRFRNATFALLS